MAGHYFNTVENTVTGKPVANATIEVFTSSAVVSGSASDGTLAVTGSYANVFSDDGVTLVDQPNEFVTTGSTGFFEFWTNESSVVFLVSYDGAPRWAVTDVEILDGDLAGYAARAQAAAEAAEESQAIVEDLAVQVQEDADTSAAAATAAQVAASSTGGVYADETAFLAGTDPGDIALIVPDGGPAGYYENDSDTSAVERSLLPDRYAPPFTGQKRGAFLWSPGGAEDDQEYARFDTLNTQPSSILDITDTTLRQGMTGQQTAPTTRFTHVVDGDELVVTNTFTSGIAQIAGEAFTTPIVFGDVYDSGNITFTAISGGGFPVAVVCGFLPSAPTGGGAIISIPTNDFVALINRQDGFLADMNRDASNDGAASGHSFQTQVEWGVDDVHRFIMRPTNALCTEARIVWFLNGAPIWTADAADLPTGSYFYIGVRFGGVAATVRLSSPTIYGRSANIPLTIHIDSDDTTGDGSAENPCGTGAEANTILTADTGRRHLRLKLKGSEVIRDAFQYYAEDYDLIEIEGDPVDQPEIRASVDMSGATWTNISGAYWKTPNPGYLDNNANYGSLFLVGTGWDETFGLNGDTTVEGWLGLERLTQDTAITDPTFVSGCSSVHRTGDHAGNIVMRMPDDSNPNGRPLEFSVYDAAIKITSRDGGYVGTMVRLSNLKCSLGFVGAAIFEDVRVEARNCVFQGGQGFGIENQRTILNADGIETIGTGADGIHYSTTGTEPAAKLRSSIKNWKHRGSRYRTVGGGDGLSNHGHRWHEVLVEDSEIYSCGKAGVATPGSVTISNTIIGDCYDSCVFLYSAEGDDDAGASEVVVHGGRLYGSTYLLQANASLVAGEPSRTLKAIGVKLDSSVSGSNEVETLALAYSETAGAQAVIELHDCKRRGPAVTRSDVVDSSTPFEEGGFSANTDGFAYVYTYEDVAGGSPLP